jgi:hypothetical protein
MHLFPLPPGASRSAICVAVAIVAAAPALAQNTTSAVGGTVTTADGQPVAGATVTVLHVESRTTASTTTDAGGRYAARGLRVGGPYTVTVSKDGKTEVKEGVFLALAETLTLDLQLGTAQQVVVTGTANRDRFNAAVMGAGTSINSAQVAALPSISRNLQDLARIDPRVAQTDKERGEISAAGQNSRYNAVTIDGVNISDTFGLESNNLPTAKQPISMEAIQSVQVNLSNYDVTQKGYTGANINAVTKSGTNEFHGSVYYAYRNDTMSGPRYNRTTGGDTPVPVFKETTKGVTLGGPIIPDKLFFFANYEELSSSRNSPEFGPLGSALTNVGISQSAIDGLRTIGQDVYGINLGDLNASGSPELNVKDTLLRLDWSINDSHRAMLRYSKTDQSEPIFSNFGTRSLSLSSHWYSQVKSIDSLVAQWFGDWTSNFSTEFRVSQRNYDSVPRNNSTLPTIAFDFSGPVPTGVTSGERTLWTGTERSRHYNELRTKTLDLFLAGNLNLDRHELKFGADLSRNKIFNAFLQDANGQFKFQCETSFGQDCSTAASVEAAVLENFRLGRVSAYQAQLPRPGKTLDDGIARWNLNNTGLFVQDTFKLDKALSLTVGARVDQLDIPQKPAANTAAQAALVPGNPATSTAQSGGFGMDNTVTPDGTSLFQPRLGFNWNLGTDERKRQLRGGFGLFQGAAANVWLSNPFSNTGNAMAFYGCGPNSEMSGASKSNSAACATSGVFAIDRANLRAIGNVPTSNVDFLDPSLRQPSVWKFNLAYEMELPWHGLVLGTEWMHTRNKNGIYYQHLNLGPATRTGPDGRELYYNAAAYDPGCWTNTNGNPCSGARAKSLANSAFGNVLLATNTSKGGGNALTLSLSQSPSRSFSWGTAYTRTSAKEVSPLTSSVSSSNFNARAVFNPNEEVAANSNYLVRDRISATLNWSAALVSGYKTTFGMVYEGRRGKPYSWTFNNDMNGDGIAGNDLMYIPSAPGSGEVVFAGGAADEARFWETVNSSRELRNSRGKVVSRNGSFAPFVNTIDLRLSQEIPGLLPKHKGLITFDFLNFTNFLDRNWGRIDEVGFQSAGGLARSFVNFKGIDPATGKYVYSTMATTEDLTTRQAKGESQWAIQVTVKYEF